MDREEAIKILTLFREEWDRHSKTPNAKALNMAIEALQEQKQKKERCEYCKDGKSFIGQRVILGNDSTCHIINYCPNCGADMRGKKDE